MIDKIITIGVSVTIVSGLLSGSCLVYERICALADDYSKCSAVIEKSLVEGSLNGSFNTDILEEIQNNE